MFYINHEYLAQLENPQEAIIEDVWRTWRTSLLDQSVASDDYNTLLSMSIKTIATNSGILWKAESGETIGKILQQDFSDIRDRKHVSIWSKRAITLTFAKLVEFTPEDIQKVITLPPSEKALFEMARVEAYNEARIKINKMITDMRKTVTNENYESEWKDFVKLTLYEIGVLGKYSEERLRRYLPIAFERFYNLTAFKDIMTKFNIQHGVITSIINKITEDFNTNIMSTPDELEMFDKKLIALYEHLYETLDKTNDEWGKRLDLIKTFRRYFVGKPLDE
jgi:hypothetical protein